MAQEKKKSAKVATKTAEPKKRTSKVSAAAPVEGSLAASPPVAQTIKSAKTKIKSAAQSPVVAEVVAATLVAAAAALRDPKRARAMATEVADDLREATKQAEAKAGAFWQMALDIARKSVDAMTTASEGGKKRKKDGKSKEKTGKKKKK